MGSDNYLDLSTPEGICDALAANHDVADLLQADPTCIRRLAADRDTLAVELEGANHREALALQRMRAAESRAEAAERRERATDECARGRLRLIERLEMERDDARAEVAKLRTNLQRADANALCGRLAGDPDDEHYFAELALEEQERRDALAACGNALTATELVADSEVRAWTAAMAASEVA
jgi:hypothetical protein